MIEKPYRQVSGNSLEASSDKGMQTKDGVCEGWWSNESANETGFGVNLISNA